MARSKEVKVHLTPDQFSINEKGELVIQEAEVIKTLQQHQATTTPINTAAADRIEVSVSVSVRF